MKPLIVHVSADYPDAWQSRKTRAVAALVEGTADFFDHRVYSLNRVGSGWRALLRPGSPIDRIGEGQVVSWLYAQPPKGVLLATAMRRLADAIAADLRSRGLRPTLVQGHKLSIEGIAARQIARSFGVPYVLTLQGNTDQKIIALRPDLRRLYRQVWSEASAVMAFAPWIARWCEAKLGPAARQPSALPCVPAAERMIAPKATPLRIASAFHLDHWRNKNIKTLVEAFRQVRREFPEAVLEVAGKGSAEAENMVDRILDRAGGAPYARRVGHMSGGALQEWMNSGTVFVLPSRRESFGMVFVEALLAGCPIIYPRGAAIDGYFDDAPFASGVDAQSPEAIAAAIARIIQEADCLKAALAQWQDSGDAERFRSATILKGYRALLEKALS